MMISYLMMTTFNFIYLIFECMISYNMEFIEKKLTKCGHLEVKTFLLVSLILSLL
jgi:hypothetical protein